MNKQKLDGWRECRNVGHFNPDQFCPKQAKTGERCRGIEDGGRHLPIVQLRLLCRAQLGFGGTEARLLNAIKAAKQDYLLVKAEQGRILR